mmetsp:Transcript_13538/g.34402  ORF Transcript_13538/g.34402 Transcript_13538/m.34402 type:complete len:221 (+) Transcript_13538:111-773(+)
MRLSHQPPRKSNPAREHCSSCRRLRAEIRLKLPGPHSVAHIDRPLCPRAAVSRRKPERKGRWMHVLLRRPGGCMSCSIGPVDACLAPSARWTHGLLRRPESAARSEQSAAEGGDHRTMTDSGAKPTAASAPPAPSGPIGGARLALALPPATWCTKASGPQTSTATSSPGSGKWRSSTSAQRRPVPSPPRQPHPAGASRVSVRCMCSLPGNSRCRRSISRT